MSPLLQIRFRTLAVATLALPLGAFVFCICWSLLFNFESSTSTHCRVRNYLPSISAAIGGYTPQLYVWRIAIAVHSAPRFLVATMYYSHLCSIVARDPVWQWLCFLVLGLQVTEICSLVGLTYISSSDNFPIHEKLFVTFMLTALGNMFLLCTLPRYVCTKHQVLRIGKKSLKFKRVLAVVNVLSFAVAVYCYFRHNWYCEPGMYTLFALFEYTVVLTNMCFHMTAYWDFSDQLISVCSY